MKFGVSTLVLYREKKINLAKFIESNADIERWEFLDEGYNRLSNEQIKGLMEFSDDKKFSIHSPFSSINIAEPSKTLRRTFLKILSKSLKSAYKIGAEAWILHPGYYTPFTIHFQELAQKTSLDSINLLSKEAKNYGVPLYIENLPGRNALLNDLKSTESFLEEVEGDVNLCLDTGHANIFEGSEAFMKRLHERIGYIHAHDNVRDFDRHLAVGEGTVNWVALTSLLKKFRFEGWVTVENLSMEDSRKSLDAIIKLLND